MDQLNLANLYRNKSISRKKYPILRGPKQTKTWRMIRKKIQNANELSRALYMEKHHHCSSMKSCAVLHCNRSPMAVK